MLTRAGLCLAMGVVLVAGYHTPVWLVPFGIVFEGVSLAWFYLIQKDCEKGHFFPSSSLNTVVSYLLRWELHLAVAILLTATQVWSFGALLKFWLLPFLVMQATLATTTNADEARSTASQVSDLLDIAQQADQSSVFRRQVTLAVLVPMLALVSLSVSGDQDEEEDCPLRLAVWGCTPSNSNVPYSVPGWLAEERGSGSFGSNADLAGSAKKKTPLEQILNVIGWPARYLFREMWLWTERDLTLYAVVSLFLVEVYVGMQYFAWSPVCLLYPILSSSSGSRKAQELQDELVMIFAPESLCSALFCLLLAAWAVAVKAVCLAIKTAGIDSGAE
ncbi:fat-7 [Symbiodinium pilosum]|uniref:Fat-7 protein n=1 Tax=Symbiodinium pilosum TaxID=2952 RepID=A0A812WNJ4_SYMPI|nr:fat-7 [Symbiodinium pilosum]